MAADMRQRNAALNRLPVQYARALRLRDAGIPDEVTAECIGVEIEGLPLVMRVAEAKLATAMATRAQVNSRSGPNPPEGEDDEHQHPQAAHRDAGCDRADRRACRSNAHGANGTR
ncbi:hypothetical protein MPUL_05090 [Mycolicibacterium pulveris]|uniref:Uncharacterized protein n=1 Tax=Mycolicibacterium pulveris TaxID=36813 RepID=A0A7I7UES9_MYCPV|nr:hypothetical protein MPUL_05090 [Mycolicibacterium pulveris]